MIRTPPGWGADVLTRVYNSVTSAHPDRQNGVTGVPDVRRIHFADLRWAIEHGIEDFGASRTDVIFLCAVYPLLGLLLARVASGYDMLPLVFPLASGFALVGPLAAVGLEEMSRRRERGEPAGLGAAFSAFRSPSIGAIMLLGVVLMMMLVSWLVLSNAVYSVTLGPQPPVSVTGFINDVLYTHAGRTMMVVGVGSGFIFAVIALMISAVSFPMLLDRNVSLETAVLTSVRVVVRNPVTMATWGLIVAASLVIGSIPVLLGLIFVMPVLGHATWHLYRRAVPR